MAEYKARHIAFREVIESGDWSIKAYVISQDGDFDHPEFFESVKTQLPEWLSMQNSFDSSKEKYGFLIMHSAKEGILTLINWWVGKNMLNTQIFLTNPEKPDVHTKISGDGLGPCVWELAVFNHERLSWLEHFLKKESDPDYSTYLSDVYNGIV